MHKIPEHESAELLEYEIRMYGRDVFYDFSQWCFLKTQALLGDPFEYIRQMGGPERLLEQWGIRYDATCH